MTDKELEIPSLIQFRRAISDYWNDLDSVTSPFVPDAGEPIYETDTRKMKIGDGVNSYKSLPYVLNTSSSISSLSGTSIVNPSANDLILYTIIDPQKNIGFWKNTSYADAGIATTAQLNLKADILNGSLTNPTITNKLTLQQSGADTVVIGNDANGAISLGKINGSVSTPYIDFHSAATASDYNVRLAVSGGTSVAGDGNLTINAGQVNLPTQTYMPGSVVQVQHVRTNTAYDITNQNIAAIPGLTISFTPKFANSKILLTAMINSNAVYVTSYGFLKDGVSFGTTSPNSNTLSSVWTTYTGQGTGTNTNMYGAYVEWLDDTTLSTTTRTYAAGITSSWSDVIYTVRVNDRSDNVMRSYSSMTIYEIAQ